MVSYRHISLLLVATALATACVESEPPPEIPQQVSVSYGARIYLVDDSQRVPAGNVCTKFGTVTSSAAAVEVVVQEGFGTGTLTGNELAEPHNCFIPVTPKTITVDQVEVTNDLYQLCVDSDICRRPDPSDASESQVCSEEDGFDRCPVVDVPRSEAERLCTFIGRRLPTMVEHIAIRQAGFVNTANPQPSQMLPFPTGVQAPQACSDARLSGPCNGATTPAPVGPQDAPTGAAVGDAVMADNGNIYDLIGNQTEWSSDGFAANRGPATGLPWFCIAPLIENDPPTCPVIDAGTGETAPCVYGDYQPAGLPYGTYPVCITTSNASFSGQIGALAGGGIQDQLEDRQTVGVFARRVSDDPNFVNNTERSFGIRCIDDRPSADANGDLMPFNFVEVDTTFDP